jgi:hypothetical protein
VETDAEAIGDFNLTLHTGFTLKLTNVLYVPSMKRNLVSVSCLDDDGYHCTFGNGRCIIMYNNKEVGFALQEERLYSIMFSDTIYNVGSSSNTNIGTKLKGKCAFGPFLSILVIKCQHECLNVNLCLWMNKVQSTSKGMFLSLSTLVLCTNIFV